VGVIWFLVEKNVIWSSKLERGGWSTVYEVCGGVESFYPKGRRKLGLKKKGMKDIIDGMNGSFNFAILRRCVWT
jgi:hypothetical protein